MVLHIATQSLVLLLIATATSQYMPPPSFPYPPYQQGQSPMPLMPMMHVPNGPPMMPMNGGSMMPMNGGPMMPPMIPHMPRLPGMSSGPMHMPMIFPMHGGRLPMVVMPHYSKKADKPRKKNHKSKHKRINMDSSSSEGSCSESAEFRSKNNLRSSKKRREVLTPVVSYVTKDGFVVYQKKIKKDKAKDWLELTKGNKHDSREYKEKIRFRDREH